MAAEPYGFLRAKCARLCHRDRSLLQGMNAERWLDVLADFPTVDGKASR